MSQTTTQSSDVIMALFGFIVSVVGASAAKESLEGDGGFAWVLWMTVVAGGGMVLGVAINNLVLKDSKPAHPKHEPAKKSEKPKKAVKKKVNA